MALTWLGAYRVPVILLSATLPAQRRSELVKAYLTGKTGKPYKSQQAEWETSQDYPLLTYTDGLEVRQVTIHCTNTGRAVFLEQWPMAFAEQTDKLAQELSRLPSGGCAGIIVNTVKRAQKFYNIIRHNMPQATVLLYHASFLATDRLLKERDIQTHVGKRSTAKERDRVIVIGTQVLEQSLDIDFDVLFTDLCPVDLLLQRIGRLHRHQRQRPQELSTSRCVIFDGANGEFDKGAALIYGEYLLMRTRAFLPDKVVLPDDISPLVQRVYGSDPPVPMPDGYEQAKSEQEHKNNESRNNANVYRLQAPSSRHKDLSNFISDGLQEL